MSIFGFFVLSCPARYSFRKISFTAPPWTNYREDGSQRGMNPRPLGNEVSALPLSYNYWTHRVTGASRNYLNGQQLFPVVSRRRERQEGRFVAVAVVDVARAAEGRRRRRRRGAEPTAHGGRVEVLAGGGFRRHEGAEVAAGVAEGDRGSGAM